MSQLVRVFLIALCLNNALGRKLGVPVSEKPAPNNPAGNVSDKKKIVLKVPPKPYKRDKISGAVYGIQ